jgi:ferric-dicitrate binding protein FerR (iron transport regulator)
MVRVEAFPTALASSFARPAVSPTLLPQGPQTGRLIFHGTPLQEIASEFNRYNSAPRLRVEGNALKARRFDGSFNALRPESFLAYLAQEQGLSFERRGDEVVIGSVKN